MIKRQKIVYAIFLSIIAILWFIRTSLDQSLMEKDEKYYQMNIEIQKLTTQNMVLKAKVSEQTSYKTIEDKARQMGFK